MMMAGTPCPYEGKIGDDAKTAWMENVDQITAKSKYHKSKKNFNHSTGKGTQ